MHYSHISNIIGHYRIYSAYGYVVLLGEKLWIFQTDGSLVICKEGFYSANKLIFLSSGHILVGGGKNAMYQLILLRDGSVVWQIKQNKKVTVTSNRFAVAPDESCAYDFYSWKESYYLVRIDLYSGTASCRRLHEGFRALLDITCDAKGRVCLLQTQYDNQGVDRISRNEMRILDEQGSSHREYEFQFRAPSIAAFFWNPEKILMNDLNVYNLRTGANDSLLKNVLNCQAYGFGPNDIWFDHSGQYLCTMYDNANIILDCITGRVVGVYAGDFSRGCLINGEYWISSEAGIRIMPFPYIEDIPVRRTLFLFPRE